ncbi:DUF4129 domain-containing protein [Microbacterium sp. C7(2022)]|uniref:DUF4129 domain-containing protein n=1 Tax=Microbacterium sp. C7(2022) TaxID=2992759 RepID=UPI00237B1CD5|nr:DUF4129 domain-containing protein [Microbacterium sp. C7(2022)]MDE0547302.1 DUF4129 domain-containing protein [Microbacterium sp. C7(2022)]
MTPRALILSVSASVPPLDPDRDEAQRWAEDELSNPVYDIAEPTPLDRLAQAVADFIANLFSPELPSTVGPAVAIIAAVVVVALIALAFVIWGRPRAIHRTSGSSTVLFDGDDERSADELRAAAIAAARAGEWDAAIIDRFRAVARGCAERGVVNLPPGATVHAFARRAGTVFPEFSADLETAASTFDDVRYLRRPGNSSLYQQVAAVDEAVASSRPRLIDDESTDGRRPDLERV